MQASESILLLNHENSIETVMDIHGKEIYHIVFCYVNDKSIAEDLTQEVFLTAHLKLDSFRNESSLKTWITRIAINKCKDYLRSSYFKQTILTNIISTFVKNKSNSPEDEIFQKNENETLANLIFKLPIKYREVILLYYYQEYTIKEISNLLKANEATIKSRLKRGREQLKLKIEESDFL